MGFNSAFKGLIETGVSLCFIHWTDFVNGTVLKYSTFYFI